MSTTLHTSNFKPFHMLIFNESIVVLEKNTREKFTGKIAFGGMPIKKKLKKRDFIIVLESKT